MGDDDWIRDYQRTHQRCPEPFGGDGYGICAMRCPWYQGFTNGERVVRGEQMTCVYREDPTVKVDVMQLDTALFEGTTIEDVARVDAAAAARYTEEKERFDGAIRNALAQIDKNTKIKDAFKMLQDAENNRDDAPTAYQMARNAYYTLVQGPEWLDTEKERVTKSEVDPEIARYRSAYDEIASRQDTQRKTQDVVDSVKDGVLSLKDDFQYTTQTFKEQIETLKNQINLERRGREKPDSDEKGFFPWIDLILNICIIAGLIFAGLTFARKLYYRASSYVSPPTFIGPRLPYA